MNFEDSKYADLVLEKIEYEFGSIYFLEDILVSEINEGVIFNWKYGEKVVKDARHLFGDDYTPHYISNRIYKYYTVSKDWIYFFKNRYFIKSFSVIAFHSHEMMNLVFERMFYKRKIYIVNSIDEAFDNIYELKKLESDNK
ncbi:hypothetical protein [Zunongwangia sp. HRR-M8]|uniref:hypothetical protein n=1 Tax=Zunongwangia sp. HRR-M8 TaxID=3015170 RepID=UPI0022DD644A|nr:hypothetical protein [Zunongwangia sp. HRR-M8]WBL21668.1 hypothetical protein PBT89_13105 [Zunongwangia sp. HRR-M8]